MIEDASPPSSADVVVVGGGPTGVAAAWRAALAGRSVVLVEASDRLGGLARSVDVAGHPVDIGSHRLHPDCEPRILAELQALLGDELIARPRHGRIRLDGRWIGFPLRPLDLARHAPPALAAGFVRDVAVRPFRRSTDAPDFASGIRGALGSTMADRFYLPYSRKLFGVGPADLDAELVRRRVSAGSPQALIRRVLRGARGGQHFWYPRGGFGRITDVMAEAAADAGADLRLARRLTRVEVSPDGRSAVVEAETADGLERIETPLVWSTIPVPSLVAALGDQLPPPVHEDVAALRYRSALVVHAVLDRPTFTGFDAHYLPGAETPITRVSEPAHYRDEAGRAPRTVICAELPGAPGDPWWTTDGDAAAAMLSRDLTSLGIDPGPVVHAEVRVVRHLYPVYLLGSLDRVRAAERAVDGLGPIVQFGRQALFAHDNTHHGLASAWAAAECLRPDGFDREAWTRRRATFDEHVVVD